MGLLTDIYNTVAKFFRSQEVLGEEDPSKSVATNRLKLVLMQDRTNLTPRVLEQMRGELVDLLSKYLEMDKDLLELNFEQEGDQVALMLSIPVIRAKDEDEIGVNEEVNEEVSEGEEEEESNDEEETEDVVEEASEEQSEEAPKPKRRRTKKVTPPQDLESSDEQGESNNEEPQQVEFENTEA